MKHSTLIRREVINWIFILLPFIYIAAVYAKLPKIKLFPLNWEQGIYYVIFFTMGVALFWYVILLIKPAIVPKTTFHENLTSFHRIKTLMIGFCSLLCLTYVSEKIGARFDWSRIGFLLAMAFIMAFGNLYPTIRYNYMIGIKNAWTLSNEIIWKKTHRFAGWVFFWGGLAGALYGIFFNPFPVPYMPAIYVGYVFILGLIPKIYAYYLYKGSRS